MADIELRDLDEGLVDFLRRRAEQAGHSLEDEVRRVLRDYAERGRKAWIDRLRAFQEEMQAQYGVMPDSTPVIREMRDERG